MSHQIANLIHVADNWDRLINGANIEIRSERREPIVSDSLEGFLGDYRYYR
jgi:hypothetical protein